MDSREELMRLLAEYSIQIIKLFPAAASALDLHPTDLRALNALWTEFEAPTAGQLGEALGLSSAAVTGLVDRLEHAGHVERVPDPADRRRVRLHITDQAGRAAEAYWAPLSERLLAGIADFDDDDLKAVARFLRAATEATRAHREPS
jgi:DNA-binding MarR family transcriptional regulator